MNNKTDFWFARVDIDVARDKELSVMARFVFMILCTFADKENRGCWPSNETVAEAAGISLATLKRAYKELEDRGVITRETRFNNGQQISSYTLIVGHNAPCYEGFTSEPAGGSPMSHRTRINEQDIKDSLTREAELPCYDEMPVAFENGQPVTPETPRPDNPKEVCTPEDAPDIMKPTAELFLHKTGRKGLTWEEISALRELSASHYPSRVQKEIDTAVKRFIRRGQSLSGLTLCYIAGSLKHQPSRAPKKPKSKPKSEDTPILTSAETEAMRSKIEAMEAEIDEEDRR